MTEPDLTRLTFSPTKAAGFARSSATSIWSSDTLAGFVAVAILLAVSPNLTVTCSFCDVDLTTATGPAAGRAGVLGVLWLDRQVEVLLKRVAVLILSKPPC